MSCSSAAYSSHSRSRSLEPVDAARLIEERQRQPRDLLRVLRPVAAALGQLDDAAAADVGIAIDLRDLLAVPVDVVEDQPFAQRQVAQRDLVGAEPAQHACRAAPTPATARSARRGSSPGMCSRCFEIERDQPLAQPADLLWRRRAGCAARRRGASPSAAERHRAEAEDRARRADHAVEAGARRCVRGSCRSPCRCACTSLRSSRGASGSVLTKRSVRRITPSLKLRAELDGRAGAERDLDAAAADVDDHGRRRPACRRRRPRPDGSAALLRCRR